MQCVIVFFPSYFTVLASGQKKKRERKRSNTGSLEWLRAGRELRNERTEWMSVIQTGNLVCSCVMRCCEYVAGVVMVGDDVCNGDVTTMMSAE